MVSSKKAAKKKVGFVALIGRPNAGKSTLLNNLLGKKISIISSVPQTTRYQIKGILNLKNSQIVFIDTPGIHSFKDKLTAHLNTIAKKSLEGCDLVIYVADSSRRVGKEEQRLVKVAVNSGIKVIMALNKIDLGGRFLDDYVQLWQSHKRPGSRDNLLYYLPLSAKTGQNLDKLKGILVENVPEGEFFYSRDCLTDFPFEFRIADIVREKLFLSLKEELPHSVAVEAEEITEKKKSLFIKVNIYVKRSSQKKIVIGSGGSVLREAGKLARKEIEGIYKKKVFLDIWVRVLSDWPQRVRILKKLGYWWL